MAGQDQPTALGSGRAHASSGPAEGNTSARYWQQAYFGGTHAVDDETQTEEAAANEAENLGEKTDEQKGTKRKAEQPRGKLKWNNLHGVSTQEVLALETDSFIQDVEEAAELPTLPLPTMLEGDTNATTVPRMAPSAAEDEGTAHNQLQGNRARVPDPPLRRGSTARLPALSHTVDVGSTVFSSVSMGRSRQGEATVLYLAIPRTSCFNLIP